MPSPSVQVRLSSISQARRSLPHIQTAVTQSDDIAQYLKSVANLETALPGLLGWQIDDMNESPLLYAVIHSKLDILKQLIVLKPNLMEEALHKRCGSP